MLTFYLVKFIKVKKNKYDSVPVNIGIDMWSWKLKLWSFLFIVLSIGKVKLLIMLIKFLALLNVLDIFEGNNVLYDFNKFQLNKT